MPATQLSTAVAMLARQADAATTREEQLQAAKEGMTVGADCIRRAPTSPACYYYRAMATGRYYEVRVIGYQTGVKHMVEDLAKVTQLAPDFDHAGAYRMLGQLFTQLPKTTIHPADLTRDLDRARGYLTEAVRRAPDYPENHLALCAALAEADARHEAVVACDRATALAQRWPVMAERHQWVAAGSKLKKRLVK